MVWLRISSYLQAQAPIMSHLDLMTISPTRRQGRRLVTPRVVAASVNRPQQPQRCKKRKASTDLTYRAFGPRGRPLRQSDSYMVKLRQLRECNMRETPCACSRCRRTFLQQFNASLCAYSCQARGVCRSLPGVDCSIAGANPSVQHRQQV
jgi:hypothetical protein